MPELGAVERRYQDRPSLAAGVAARIAETLMSALAVRPRASLILPGGTTPGPVFDRLSTADLDWSRVDVTLSDERWVAPNHADSNERLVGERLLRNKAAMARLISLYRALPKPSAALAEIGLALGAMTRPFDVALLGLGADGHFASLFPGRPELSAGLDREAKAQVIALDEPANGHPRISLSLAALLNTRLILVLFQGMDKYAVLETAKSAGSSLDLPIRALLDQDMTPVEAHPREISSQAST